MKTWPCMVAGVVSLIAGSAIVGFAADARVLCAKRSKVVVLRTACRPGEAKIDVTEFVTGGSEGNGPGHLEITQVFLEDYRPVPVGAEGGVGGLGPVPGIYVGMAKAVIRVTGPATRAVVCHIDGQGQPNVDTASVVVPSGGAATLAMFGRFQVLPTLGLGGDFRMRCAADGSGAEIGEIKLLAVNLRVTPDSP